MKKGTRLLVLTAAIVVFAAGAVILKGINDAREKAKNVTEEKPVVLALNKDSLTGIAYTYQGENLRFEKLDGHWRYADDTGFPLKESLVTAMASALEKVTASRKVADTLDKAEEYGLKEPSATVTAELDDGTRATLYLGGKSSVTGDTYAYAEGSQTVYTVASSVVSKFSYKLYGLITDEAFPAVEASAIGKIAFTSGEKSLTLENFPGGSEASYSSLYTWFVQGADGTEKPLDSQKVSDYLEGLTGTAFTGTADYSAAEEELGAWGLSTPSAVIAVDYTVSHTETVPKATATPGPGVSPEAAAGEGTSAPEASPGPTPATETVTVTEPKQLILYLGGRAEDGSYYLRHSGSSRVFTISADTYAKLTGLSVETLLPDQFALISIDTVDGLTVSTGGQTREYTIARSAGTGEDGKALVTAAYAKDGAEIGETAFKDFYKALIGLQREAATDKAPAGEPYLTAAFHRNTVHYKEMTLVLYPYDASFYQAGFNGETGILVNKREVESLVNAMNAAES